MSQDGFRLFIFCLKLISFLDLNLWLVRWYFSANSSGFRVPRYQGCSCLYQFKVCELGIYFKLNIIMYFKSWIQDYANKLAKFLCVNFAIQLPFSFYYLPGYNLYCHISNLVIFAILTLKVICTSKTSKNLAWNEQST